MEATHTPTLIAARSTASRPALAGVVSTVRAVVRAVVENARGTELDHILTSSSQSQFSSLPRSEQNRMLDRGFRP